MTNIKSEKVGEDGEAVIPDQGRFVRNAKIILVLCAIVFVIGSLFVDDGYPSLTGAVKLVLKLVGVLLHMM
jgi:hypothetical protein